MMGGRRIRTWEELEALPEGEWVHLAGIDAEVVDVTPRKKSARVVIPLRPKDAQSLRPRPGEVLEARFKGESLEIVRRRAKRG